MVPSFRFLYTNSQLCSAGIGLLTTICFNPTFFLNVCPREIKISKGNISEGEERKLKRRMFKLKMALEFKLCLSYVLPLTCALVSLSGLSTMGMVALSFKQDLQKCCLDITEVCPLWLHCLVRFPFVIASLQVSYDTPLHRVEDRSQRQITTENDSSIAFRKYRALASFSSYDQLTP